MTNTGITDCTLHYVVLAGGSSMTPQLLLDNSNAGYPLYRSQVVAAGDTFQLTFESGVGAYVFYSIFERTDGALSALTTAPVAVLIAPALGTPVVSDFGVTIPVTNPNAAGYALCYLFLDVTADAPDTIEIFEDQGGAVWVPSGAHDALLPALPAGTYTLYAYFHGDGAGSVLYAHAAPLRVLPVPVLSVVSAPGSEATVSVRNSDAANPYTFYYVVLFADEEAPSASYILDNSDGQVQVGVTIEDIVLSDLSGGTCRLYGIFAAGGVSSLVASTAPFTILHAPRLEAYVSGGLSITVHNDGPTDCLLHYQVLAASAAVPAPGFTMGTNYGTQGVAALSSFEALFSGLPAGAYRFHAYFSSVGASAVASTEALTILHAPRFDPPAVSDADLTLTVQNSGNATCTLHYVVLPAATPVPTVNGIESAGTFSGSVSVSSGAAVDVAVQGLPYAAHKFHAFFELEAGMTSLVSSSDSFTPLTAPRFSAAVLMAESATFVVQSTNDSILRLYWVVCPAEVEVPTKDAIETATALGGNTSVGVDGSHRISVHDLTPDTAYRFHAFFEAEVDDISSAVSSSESSTTLSYDHALGFVSPSVSILPNPVADVLTIQSSSSGTALLYDLSGVLLDSRAITPGTSTLSFLDHPTGLYLVRFVFADGEIIRRVVRR